MKKLLMLIIIGFALFATFPAQADHRFGNPYGYNSYPGYGGYFHRGNNFNRWHDPYGYHNHRYGHRHDRWRNRQINRDIAGVIIGGIILGQIFNNNLELLFQGPTLRTFNFRYKFSPRDESEIKNVMKIIRAFKQSSAVQRSQSGLFLVTPNTYRLEFKKGGAKLETSNRHLSLIHI